MARIGGAVSEIRRLQTIHQFFERSIREHKEHVQ